MSDLEHIIEILRRIEKKQEEFFSEVRAMVENQQSGDNQWVDSLEVQRLLSISESTLRRHRKKNILFSKLIGGRHYYYLPDIFGIKDYYLK